MTLGLVFGFSLARLGQEANAGTSLWLLNPLGPRLAQGWGESGADPSGALSPSSGPLPLNSSSSEFQNGFSMAAFSGM